MSRNDVTVIHHDDVILIGWSIPPVYHTLAIIEQCSDDVTTDTLCIEHDVTSNPSIGLSRLNGTSLSLVVYQDRDEVVRLRLAQEESNDKDDDTGWSVEQSVILPNSAE